MNYHDRVVLDAGIDKISEKQSDISSSEVAMSHANQNGDIVSSPDEQGGMMSQELSESHDVERAFLGKAKESSPASAASHEAGEAKSQNMTRTIGVEVGLPSISRGANPVGKSTQDEELNDADHNVETKNSSVNDGVVAEQTFSNSVSLDDDDKLAVELLTR